jgi:biotin carboxyl carrier protein
MEFEFIARGERHKISLENKESRYVFRLGDRMFEAEIQAISANAILLIVDGRSHLIHIARDKDKLHASLDGEVFVLHKPGAGERRFERGEDRGREGTPMVTAPMPGKVIKVCVAEQEEVRKNQTLAIVEAMKMENEIKSPLEGRIKKVFVTAGDLVDSEKPLLELEPKT